MSEAAWGERLHRASAGALYLHLPFCVQKCGYCDFSSWATEASDPVVGAYVDALVRMMRQAADMGLLGGCATAYVGGGTPTLAGEGLVRLVREVRECCPDVRELTCEANPDSLSDALLVALPSAGCTRLSMGVQSLDDEELRLLGRIHDARVARERLVAAVATGMDVSCDLMCAIPGQMDESWRATLAGVLDCGVSHVSVYPLQIEEGTPFDACYEDGASFNDTEVQAARMTAARETLEAASLARYEVASYARSGKECCHNQAYWTGVPYLGLGTSASSMMTREGYERLREVAPQLPVADVDAARVRLTCMSGRREFAAAPSLADLGFEVEFLTEGQAAAEDLMLGMRLVKGADAGLLAHAREVLGKEAVDAAFGWCEERGLVSREEGTCRPTEQGWLLGNELYGRMWELADLA